MKPLKALVITPIYPSPDNPQAGIFIHRQIVNLNRLGVECRVLVYRPAPPPFPLWLRRRSWLRYYWGKLGWPRSLDGVRTDTVFYKRLWVKDEDVVPEIGEALVRHIEAHRELSDTDVVYAHFLWTAGAAALRVREKFGWPVAAIARGSEMHEWQELYPSCRPHVENTLRQADQILANCADLKDRAIRFVPDMTSPVEVIYNGCDIEKFRPTQDRSSLRRELRLNADARLLLFCGAIEERKGIGELMEAWRGFSEAHPEWQLVVVGRAADKRLASRLRQTEGVLIAGQVPHERVVKYLQAADAYIQPSRLEGLANATMEAMAAGLPVITTDTCGQRELIEDGVNGWLVPPNNADALRQAVESLADDLEQAKRMGEAARRTIETKFNPQIETARLADILRKTARISAPEVLSL
ncbi:MAG TPA: glycosyltransferase [Blastocatellia bacterium]|jgi:glycosyltransferase involved in cell wall biosynthesis